MNVVERWIRKGDRLQGRHDVLAFPVAVVRKFADDRASAFAALLTYYGFLALLPLLIVALTIFGALLEDRPGLRDAVLSSVAVELPVIGDALRQNIGSLQATGIGLVVGALGLLWGATGLYKAGQLAMSQLWNVEGMNRPGFVYRIVRSLLLFTTLGLGVVASAVATRFGAFMLQPASFKVASVVAASLFNGLLLFVVFRILTPNEVPWRHLWLGAAIGGVAVEAVQLLGTWLVASRLERTGDLYGVFAYVLGAIFWIYLVSRILLFATEINVVRVRRLWPRRITQPPLTEADKRVLTALVRNEHRRPEQHIEVTYDDDADRRPA